VIPIHLPPLRERREDIPILTRYFIDKYSREFGKEIKNISVYAIELLMSYPFPGNIRELENIIERSVALETSNIILPENLVLSENAGKTTFLDDFDIPEAGMDLNDIMAKTERRLIEMALQRAGGSKTKAADLLHVSLDSLRYRIEKLNIE